MFPTKISLLFVVFFYIFILSIVFKPEIIYLFHTNIKRFVDAKFIYRKRYYGCCTENIIIVRYHFKTNIFLIYILKMHIFYASKQ